MATRSSWRPAGSSTTLAPRALTAERTVAKATGSVSAAGVSTQVAPSNMSGSDAFDAFLLGAGHGMAADEARVVDLADDRAL